MDKKFQLNYTELAGGLEYVRRTQHTKNKEGHNEALKPIMGDWYSYADTSTMQIGIAYFQDSLTRIAYTLNSILAGHLKPIDILDRSGHIIGRAFKQDSVNVSYAIFDAPSQYDTILQPYNYKKLVVLNIEDVDKTNINRNFKIVKNILFYSDCPQEIDFKVLDLYIIEIIEQIILTGTGAKGERMDEKLVEVLKEATLKALDKLKDVVIDKVKEYFEAMALECMEMEMEGVIMSIGAIAGALVFMIFEIIAYIVEKLFLPEFSQTTLYLNFTKYPFETSLVYDYYLDKGVLPSQWTNKDSDPLIIAPTNIISSFYTDKIGHGDLVLYDALTVGFLLVCYSGFRSWPIERMKQVTQFQLQEDLRKKLNLTNFINFSRYFDPLVVRQAPPTIDTVFDVNNATTFAENYTEASTFRPVISKSLSDGNALTITTELRYIPLSEDPNQRNFYEISLFMDNVTDNILKSFVKAQ